MGKIMSTYFMDGPFFVIFCNYRSFKTLHSKPIPLFERNILKNNGKMKLEVYRKVAIVLKFIDA